MTKVHDAVTASIVIPSYNHEAFIEAAVASCFDQTHPNIEVIVVDDGSKDRSLSYLRSVHAPFFTLITQENAGAHAAINRGLDAAKGEYLAILNSDDVFDPLRLEAVIAAMRTADAGFGCSWLRQIDAAGRPGPVKEGWRNQLPSWVRGDGVDGASFAQHLARSNFISTTSNMVMTRELFGEVGGMRKLRFAHDWDFAFRACVAGTPVMVERALLSYRTHATNTIRTHQAWMMFEVLWCFAVHLPALAERGDVALSTEDGRVVPPIDLGEHAQTYRDLYDHIHAGGDADAAAERLLDEPETRAPFIAAIS